MEGFRDLRDWLNRVQEIGELNTIGEEVDWNEELAAITYMAAKKVVPPSCLRRSKDILKDSRFSPISWVPVSGESH